MKQMNERSVRIYDYDFAGQPAEMSSKEQGAWAWIRARLYDLGVLEAMAPSTKPPELRINASTILFYLTVIGFIAGGFWWTWQRADEAGFQRGMMESQRKQQEAEMNRMNNELRLLNEKLKGAQ